jgi:molybdopterin/thiamine biosynthesis adenylyltransferase
VYSVKVTPQEESRYERHLLLPEVGAAGQAKLLASRVLLVGAGGLGSPIALYLAGAGVGTIGIVDNDRINLSNLQRQVIHTTSDLDRFKVQSAKDAIHRLNPDVSVVPYQERLTPSNVGSIFDEGWSLVIDACDNVRTRYLLSDACRAWKLNLIHGAVRRYEGQVTTFDPFEGPCYRCLYPKEMEDKPRISGVLGVVPGVIGTIQATEALKALLGLGTSLVGRLLVFDALSMTFQTFSIKRDPFCQPCKKI